MQSWRTARARSSQGLATDSRRTERRGNTLPRRAAQRVSRGRRFGPSSVHAWICSEWQAPDRAARDACTSSLP